MPLPRLAAVLTLAAALLAPGHPRAAPDLAQLLPGVELPPELTGAQKEQLAKFAQESFCHCGCPHTVAGCLKEHKSCKHAPRMATIAAGLAARNAPAAEIQKLVTTHYAGFDAKKRVTLNVKDFAPALGDEAAPVTLVEFSDFTCPFCQRVRADLEAFVEKNRGRVKLVYKPFPIASHPRAMEMAEAGEWARDGGFFWKMHDALFELGRPASNEDLSRLAREAGGDPASLRQALESKRYRPRIIGAQAEARIAGLTGTPTLFVNGRKYVLPDWSPEGLQLLLEEEEEWLKAKGWTRD